MKLLLTATLILGVLLAAMVLWQSRSAGSLSEVSSPLEPTQPKMALPFTNVFLLDADSRSKIKLGIAHFIKTADEAKKVNATPGSTAVSDSSKTQNDAEPNYSDRLKAKKAELDLAENELYKQRPDLEGLKDYRSKLERYYQRNSKYIRSIGQFISQPASKEDKDRRGQSIMALTTLVAAQICIGYAEIDQSYINLLRPGFEQVNQSNGGASWRALFALLYANAETVDALIPKPEDRTIERYLEDVRHHRAQIAAKYQELVDRIGIPDSVIAGIVTKSDYELLAFGEKAYVELTTRDPIKQLRGEVNRLEIIVARSTWDSQKGNAQ